MARVLDAAPDPLGWRPKPLWFGPWVGPAEAVMSADAVRSQFIDAPLREPTVERVEWAIDRGRAAVVCCSGTLGQPRLIRPMRLQRTVGDARSMPPGR